MVEFELEFSDLGGGRKEVRFSGEGEGFHGRGLRREKGRREGMKLIVAVE